MAGRAALALVKPYYVCGGLLFAAIFFGRLRRMPVVNQLLAVSIFMLMLPTIAPASLRAQTAVAIDFQRTDMEIVNDVFAFDFTSQPVFGVLAQYPATDGALGTAAGWRALSERARRSSRRSPTWIPATSRPTSRLVRSSVMACCG